MAGGGSGVGARAGAIRALVFALACLAVLLRRGARNKRHLPGVAYAKGVPVSEHYLYDPDDDYPPCTCESCTAKEQITRPPEPPMTALQMALLRDTDLLLARCDAELDQLAAKKEGVKAI